MRCQRRPHFQVELVALFRLAPQDRDVSREKIADRPGEARSRFFRIPLRDKPHNQAPLAEILGAALDPSPAF
jgi:hypothetical protein